MYMYSSFMSGSERALLLASVLPALLNMYFTCAVSLVIFDQEEKIVWPGSGIDGSKLT